MKRTLYLILIALLALGAVACGDNEPGSSAKTYSATDLPMDVPSSATSSSITVTGAPTSITKVTVKVQIPHSNTAALYVGLAGPTWPGTGSTGAVVLTDMDGTSGVAGGYINVTFDDAAPNPILSAVMPSGGFTGLYRPREALSEFIGTDGNGLWRLFFYETAGTSVNGQVLSWSITFE